MTPVISVRRIWPGTVSAGARLRFATAQTLAIVCGLSWSILFVIIGLGYELELYADGSLFSYAIAVEDAWAFHWHNISGRLFVYLFAHLPAGTYVNITGDASGGIALYGFLFFSAPLLGLVAAFAADSSKGRVIFSYACFSTACLCPLVFGFPTETWVTHALFWPALAVCHYGRPGVAGFALVFVMLLSLVFTHEGALILAIAILSSLSIRGRHDAAFLRACGAFFIVLPIWLFVKIDLPPDSYIAEVLARAALHVFDPAIVTRSLVLLLMGAAIFYATALFVFRRWSLSHGHACAALGTALALILYWLFYDRALHSGDRYYLRTAILVVTPMLGMLAIAHALAAGGKHIPALPLLPNFTAVLKSSASARGVAAALALLTLVHAVETVKFVTAWTQYKEAVRDLSQGQVSDPSLGDARFVSSKRIDANLNRLSWASTTPYLSVLLAPEFAPAKLVIDPNTSFFWLSCHTANANLKAVRAVPAESRRLIAIYSCMHR